MINEHFPGVTIHDFRMVKGDDSYEPDFRRGGSIPVWENERRGKTGDREPDLREMG